MPAFVTAYRTHPGRAEPVEAVSVSADLITLNDHLRLSLDSAALTLRFAAQPGVLQYVRLADATLVPLPPEHPPALHHLIRWQAHWHGPTLKLAAGDAYIALSPGAARFAASPAIARFLHLRDYFNAEKMAEALLAHLLELAGSDPTPEDVTVLVVEAR